MCVHFNMILKYRDFISKYGENIMLSLERKKQKFVNFDPAVQLTVSYIIYCNIILFNKKSSYNM